MSTFKRTKILGHLSGSGMCHSWSWGCELKPPIGCRDNLKSKIFNNNNKPRSQINDPTFCHKHDEKQEQTKSKARRRKHMIETRAEMYEIENKNNRKINESKPDSFKRSLDRLTKQKGEMIQITIIRNERWGFYWHYKNKKDYKGIPWTTVC